MLSTGEARLIVLGSLLGLAIGPAPRAANQVRVIRPADITWTAVAGYPPGYARAMLEGGGADSGPITYRVRLPAGFTFQPHVHARDEHVTVLEGKWYLGIGDTFDAGRLKGLPVGSFVIVPAGTPHFIATEVDTIIQVHGIGPAGFRFVGNEGGQ